MKRLLSAGVLIVAAGLFSAPLMAQGTGDVHPWLEDDFIIGLGGFMPDKEFSVRVDGAVPGQDIDFDRGVAVTNDDTSGALWFRWNFGEKWSLTGQYFATDDSGRAVLEEDIVWGDNVLKAGSNIGAGVEVDLARVFVGRTFFTEAEHHEFGLGLGLHWMQIGAYVEGEVFVNDQTTGIQRESVNADLPLPNLGAWYWYSLSPRWLLSPAWTGSTPRSATTRAASGTATPASTSRPGITWASAWPGRCSRSTSTWTSRIGMATPN